METSHGQPRFLIIDSYDSFTYNLAALFKQSIPSALIHIIKNDEFDFDELAPFLPYFSAVVVGPGPGSPAIPSDVGVVDSLWSLAEDKQMPIFGVCLGMQSLGLAFGASLRRLNVVKHGQVSRIMYNEEILFEGIPQGASVVRYHSLCVDPRDASKLVELAWADDGTENGRVTMALKHRTKPFYGVQYHPESVCTDGSGPQLVRNFWRLACEWRSKARRPVKTWDDNAERQFSVNIWPAFWTRDAHHLRFNPQRVTSTKISLPQLKVPQVCEVLGVYKANTDFVLLDSAAEPGSYSIIGCMHPNSLKIQYFVGDDFVTLIQGKRRTLSALGSCDVWTWLASFMRTKDGLGGDPTIPFWGGLVGYLSYELGFETLRCGHGKINPENKRFPDVNLVYVERSLVVDTKTGEVTIQSLLPKDDDWFAFTASALKRAAVGEEITRKSSGLERPLSASKTTVVYPDKAKYISRIKQAQDCLFSGESYELCLTARTRLLVPKSPVASSQSSWEIYKKLRSANPAPYAAYIRFHPSTLISSSPERFLSYSRPPSQLFQLRPIKGTVRKGNGMSRDCAAEILNSPKEIGENLMIVDLIRHDLHGVLGTGVDVRKFCGIEEYETVWQLVSVIEGSAYPHGESLDDIKPFVCDKQLAWEVLRKSLPPGSMTGAPKKRSVQILQDLEDDERGIYSGVMGYWCVGGGGDWSVIIRSCFRHEDEPMSQNDPTDVDNTGHDEWLVGAGGAITALSDPEAEWDEMLAKLQSVLRSFRVGE
ncbi:para-aminobenzoate synthase [Fomitiporia mediterranea MF3/22]|uniref:para-aminobenzoate synthase n=1 Tax=Fomitiporia mediterranea (strain MF3/22) TaxID=694068 RepID=UPI0004407DAE|nr:para-aminobenzoate synthase [Fomitiporia mediterranea MF3/22]EJD04199.1 para-aminobenzoate synthase [Fomitiporia mediterranea MF3/22]